MAEGRRGTVLIVEDDPGIARLESLRLKRSGYEVAHASSAVEAMGVVRRGGIDLIVLDQRLRDDVSGLDFYAELRANGHDLPAILVTGLGDEETLIRALRSGLRDFVPKTPDYLDDLVAAVDRVSDRVSTERRLAESETRLAGIVVLAEAIPQIVWTAAPDGAVDYFNHRWSEATGLPLERSAGWGWLDVVHPDDRAATLATWNDCLREDHSGEVEYRLLLADGSYRWQLVRSSPLRDRDGRIVKWFGTCTDIDDRKRDEEELRRAKRVAEDASRSKDRFLAMLSHELRTPLNPVLLAATSMASDPAIPTEIRATLDMIRRNVELEAQLIDDLLDVMRISSGKIVYHSAVEDVHALIEQAVEICRGDLAAGRVDLSLDLSASAHHVEGDAARLKQVFWNLIKNAVKFTPSGGTISIRTRDAAIAPGGSRPSLTIEVADTGIGIDPDLLPRIFDAFEQGESDYARRIGGLGLGLAICRSVVESHGGRLSASSPGKGRGSTFTVELTTVPAPAGSDHPADISCPESSGPRRLKILLVEDDPTTLTVMSRLLRREGHAVSTAVGLVSALEAARDEEFDLVVTDLGLPDGDGYDLLRRLRRHKPVTGIALSGHGSEHDLRRSRQAGFVAHLTKPIDFHTLEVEIRKVATAPA